MVYDVFSLVVLLSKKEYKMINKKSKKQKAIENERTPEALKT